MKNTKKKFKHEFKSLSIDEVLRERSSKYNFMNINKINNIKEIHPVPKKVKAPVGLTFPNITGGKEYDVQRVNKLDYNKKYGYSFHIIDDRNNNILCLEKQCSHIDDMDWIIIETE